MPPGPDGSLLPITTQAMRENWWTSGGPLADWGPASEPILVGMRPEDWAHLYGASYTRIVWEVDPPPLYARVLARALAWLILLSILLNQRPATGRK